MLSRRELAKVVAGAAALNSVAVAHADELPKDVITQPEIAALFHLETAKEVIAREFKRRLEAGATIEDGKYKLKPSMETLEEMQDSDLACGFNCPGFDSVDATEYVVQHTEIGA